MTQLDTTTPTPPTAPLMQISAERAIALCRWWLRLGTAFNAAMVAVLLVAAFVGFQRGLGSTPAFMAGLLWVGVVVMSARAKRLAFDATPLIAAGEFGLAEDRLSQSLQSFSVLRSAKLFGLQQLAMLRHAQSRWADAAKLCRELLAKHRGVDREVEVPSRLMLAESLLEMDDVAATGAELLGLANMKLSLRETLVLTQMRLDLQARHGHWQAMLSHPHATLGLIELLPASGSARCHALLALAAKQLGRADWHQLLARRAALLADVEKIVAHRPFLRDAFDGVALPAMAARADSSTQTR